MFPEVDCNIFNHPKPMSMALSVLVVIEMSNAINRYQVPLSVKGRETILNWSSQSMPFIDCYKKDYPWLIITRNALVGYCKPILYWMLLGCSKLSATKPALIGCDAMMPRFFEWLIHSLCSKASKKAYPFWLRALAYFCKSVLFWLPLSQSLSLTARMPALNWLFKTSSWLDTSEFLNDHA